MHTSEEKLKRLGFSKKAKRLHAQGLQYNRRNKLEDEEMIPIPCNTRTRDMP